MRTVNRFAVIVRPGEPYIEWAAQVFEEPHAKVRKELAEGEPSIYLLPESSAPDLSHPTVLRSHWQGIFKEELSDWCPDEATWPKHRSEALFRAWFQLTLATLVYDLGKEPLKTESY